MIIGYCLLFAVTGLAFVESTTTNCTDFRINNGPLITPCVSEIILQKGQNFTLTCKGVTKLQFRHQDLSEEVVSNFTIKESNSSINEKEYSFQNTLDLYFVDQYAIGYYACSDDSVKENIVNTITEEPENTEHVSYIYVYVNGTDSLFAPMSEVIISRSSKILIECRPSTPDVTVKLSTDIPENVNKRYGPKVGFILNYDVESYSRLNPLNMFSCDFTTKDRGMTKDIFVKRVTEPPVPEVKKVSKWFYEGETFTLNCTVNITPNTFAELEWIFPEGLSKDKVVFEVEKSPENITKGQIYNAITIFNATSEYTGNYSCKTVDVCVPKESNKVLKQYTPEPFMYLRIQNKPGITTQWYLDLTVMFDFHPKANITILKQGYNDPDAIEIVKNDKLLDDSGKYKLEYKENKFVLKIDPLNYTDTANYTVIANNGTHAINRSFELLKEAAAKVDFAVSDQTCVKGMQATFKCYVFGYPQPEISWKFSYFNNGNTEDVLLYSTSEKVTSLYDKTAFLDNKLCDKEGNITCIATTIKKRKPYHINKSHQLLVYEIPNGFGISTNSDHGIKWVIENNQVSLRCLASKYKFSNVTWVIDDSNKSSEMVVYNVTEFSYVAELIINGITVNQNGNYKCVGVKKDGSEEYDSIEINVLELHEPVIENPEDTDIEAYRNDDKYLNCSVTGAPLPEIKWFKDGEHLIKNNSNVFITYNKLNRTAINSTISIMKIQPENLGNYECVAVGESSSTKKLYTLKLKVENYGSVQHYVIAIGVIILFLIILIVYLTLKIRKEKQFRKELAAAGLYNFKEGVVNSINPDLGIDEQAELLPYDEKFEFPPEKLVYGKQLGAGAFGVVYKAEARGIINAEETTTVAVKTVKKTADNMYIKALASELKIMVHLGKHINIVNLLGACTKNVGKRELMVIVEYCMYGNIHNYMQRHREVFIDQLDTDNKEKLGKVNRAYTSTTGSTGVQSDYFGSTNTQDTANTFLNTANTVQSARKNIPNNLPTEEVKASECYVQPEWRSNYESDYSYDGRSPRPLTSRDLLAWAFQIARGMEYLASRKVLHGDLAARNILLAEDNIVKICDFGLAKSIYKNEEYQSKENCLLPVKWLAIECMTDRIFSTQSDVWSFGIVLWELFSLAKTPYPNIHPASLLSFLSEGHRLDKPSYADDRLYDVMRKCWETKPTLRPSFSHLQELLGTFLEDNVRRHYVDLNSGYMDKNANVEGQEDYLAMMCAPDYNNLVTPSPHHYVNTDNEKRFFPPTPAKVDDEGYLQMSPSNQGIFSPRLPSSEFDFDPRKFNPKTSEASSCGSELTPMLTLNNLPARSGSESDHEGNNPYLNVCPRIDEEADEVFAINETKNAKNIQRAVTNPTYITFDNIDEKPKDIINSYVNMNVPNGLVK